MTASGTTVYPGLYKARCTADNGQLLTVAVPQVFGVQAITLTDMTGDRPSPGSMGYVAFEGGDTAFPVWVSSGGLGGVSQAEQMMAQLQAYIDADPLTFSTLGQAQTALQQLQAAVQYEAQVLRKILSVTNHLSDT